MQILPDGRVQISNKRTGEVKIVTPDQLPQYGISPDAYTAQKMQFDEAVKGVKAGIVSPQDAMAIGVPVDIAQTAPKQLSAAEKKSQEASKKAAQLFGDLQNLYFAENKTEDDLSLGSGNILGRAGLKWKQLRGTGDKSNITVGGKSQELTRGERANLYKDLSEALLAQVKAAAGETGQLSDEDIKRLKKALPGFLESQSQAQTKFNVLQGNLSTMLSGDSETEALFKELGL